MTRYIFHGGGVADDGGTSFYTALLRDVPNNGTVLFCYFASRNSLEEQTENFTTVSAKMVQIHAPKKINTIFAERTNFIEQAFESDAIVLRGGSTDNLIATLKEYPNLSTAFEGKTVSGSSAGAYALSTYYSSHYNDVAAAGLGIVPVRVVTHFEGAVMQPKPGAIEALEATAPELPLIKLREGQWEEFVIE